MRAWLFHCTKVYQTVRSRLFDSRIKLSQIILLYSMGRFSNVNARTVRHAQIWKSARPIRARNKPTEVAFNPFRVLSPSHLTLLGLLHQPHTMRQQPFFSSTGKTGSDPRRTSRSTGENAAETDRNWEQLDSVTTGKTAATSTVESRQVTLATRSHAAKGNRGKETCRG